MPQRNVLVLLALGMFVLIAFNRRHLETIGETTRTYATFYSHLRANPSILFRYPTASVPGPDVYGSYKPKMVPRILHQILLTEGRPSPIAEYGPAMTGCQSLHPNWTHKIWTDENGTDFIARRYPDILADYKSYRQTIQRANILRYALLDHYGGVYLDLDVTCLHPLDELRHLPWLTPGAYPVGLNNAFILSRAKHPFLHHLLDAVKSRNLQWGMPYVENMFSTGCMLFSNRWMSYQRSQQVRQDQNRVYILADEDGRVDPHMLRGATKTPLFQHGGASSWHSWDASLIIMTGRHYVSVVCLMVICVLCLVAWIYISSRTRYRIMNARSWTKPYLGRRKENRIQVDDGLIEEGKWCGD